MKIARMPFVPALFGLALIAPVLAKAEELHHLPDATTEAPATTNQQPGIAPSMPMMGQAGMPMMNMMGQGGMPMMGMMGQGGMPMMNMMDQAGMPMMDMGLHLEGRIAFLRAEIGITQAQAPQWDAFAQAMRDSAAKLQQAPADDAPSPAGGSVDFLRRLEMQEQWLSSRLEGIKAVKTAFAGLQTVLSDDQEKTAEELLARPICFGQMGMM